MQVDITSAWFKLLTDKSLLELYKRNVYNIANNQLIIKQIYELGIIDSTDIYLNENVLGRKALDVLMMERQVTKSIIKLQLLLIEYPDGLIDIAQNLPTLDTSNLIKLPSNLLERRPDLQQSWYAILIADTKFNVAYKNSFPQLSLIGSANDISNKIDQLLNDSRISWSISININQTLFDTNKLKAAEQQASAQVKQAERRYLKQLFLAFSEVEKTVYIRNSLKKSYQLIVRSSQNSMNSYAISFEKYQRGLVAYNAVLESQRRSFEI